MKDTPNCTLADIGLEITGADATQIVEACNEYLKDFAAPKDGGKCVNCERKLGGLLGSFTWGICYGEGRCANCGWPARGYHDIKDSEDEAIFDSPLAIVLSYHPSGVTTLVSEDAESNSE